MKKSKVIRAGAMSGLSILLATSMIGCGTETKTATENHIDQTSSVSEDSNDVDSSALSADSVSEVETPVESGIDLQVLNLTDIRNMSYTTTIYQTPSGYPSVMPLKFQDAVIGLAKHDFDDDAEDELLVVTMNQDASIESEGDYSGRPDTTIGVSVYEMDADGWSMVATVPITLWEPRVDTDMRLDVFFDDSNNIFVESWGRARYLADGLSYLLKEFQYDGDLVEQHINDSIYTPEEDEISASGSDYHMTAMMDLSMDSVPQEMREEEDAQNIERFIEAYRSLGFQDSTGISHELATMDQNSGLTKVCRMNITDENLKADGIFNNQFDNIGVIDIAMIDYQNVEVLNRGLDLPQGEPAVTVSEKTDSTAVQLNYGAYNPILEQVYQQIQGNEDGETLTGVWEVASFNEADAANKIGFAITDINGDGSDELLVVDLGGQIEHNILAMYTLVNDEPVLVCEGWARSRNYLMQDGSIYTNGSAGAAYSAFGNFAISSDGTMQYKEFYFTDLDSDMQTVIFYKNSTGEWDPTVSERVEMDWDKFGELEDAYLARVNTDLQYTTFAQLES